MSNNIEIPIEQIDDGFTREETEETILNLEEIYIKNNESEVIRGSISSNDSDSVLNYSTDDDDYRDDDMVMNIIIVMVIMMMKIIMIIVLIMMTMMIAMRTIIMMMIVMMTMV